MEPGPTSLWPGRLLITVVCLLGICALPSALFFLLLGFSGDSGPNPTLVFGFGGPTLVAYTIAVWLWFRARRVRSAGRGWLLAALGVLLVVGASIVPVGILGSALADEWRETQPGGRGYQPPAGPR